MGYMIISFVKNGRMLSDTWGEYLLTDKTRRHTLFSDIAKIMVQLSRIQFPRIGSLSLDDDGLIKLTNRPLTLRLQTLENEGIPTIPRSSTFQCVEPYILDLLHCHDNRIHYQPNAIHDLNDGQEQLAALTMMKGLLPHFISSQYRDGPFILSLTDLHPSNIFVDNDWHITSLIDLEWACIFPIELQTPPYWLTGRPIDDIENGEHLQKFQEVMVEFIDAFDEQEQRLHSSAPAQAEIMRKCWDRGSFWYFQALHSPKGLLRVFNEHIQRIFCEEHCTQRVFDRTVSPYWTTKAEDFIQAKLWQETAYKDQVRKRFIEADQTCTFE
ncbi:hypothetical protein N7481_010261 [Penicillium waksmanii]|uniref:uncharacterized protein n=1 Tax=Penicillium waksmanii TaxID=69791 RepID=UPI002547F2FA|nr:uncharacterized protein N7481_010261 [Penicillium waksmanii]KAJ5976554.1 hypothetical protein N7481_010261 [Penicillium waksmanii]